MEIKGNKHIYKVIPDLFGNEESEKPAVFHLKGISSEAFEKTVINEKVFAQNFTREEAARKIADGSFNLVADHVVKIENLKIDGKEITTFSELREHAPKELVNWVVGAVHSTEVLLAYEIKN